MLFYEWFHKPLRLCCYWNNQMNKNKASDPWRDLCLTISSGGDETRREAEVAMFRQQQL